MFRKIALLFLAHKIILFIAIILANFFITKRISYDYVFLSHFFENANNLPLGSIFLPFGNFDGAYYLLIAAGGYTINAGFFPLFPLSIYFSTIPFANFPYQTLLSIQLFTGIILVSLYFFFALTMLYKLLRIDYPQKVAFWSIIFLLIFPTSFFFATIYSESLFLLLSLLTFYFARKKKWFLASLCGGLLTATRFVGIAIIPTLILEFISVEKRLFKRKALFLFLTLSGVLGYMWFNLVKWGNPFYFIQAQGNFANNRSVDSIILLPQTIFRYLKILISVKPTIYEWWVAFFELSFFVFALSILYIAWKKKIRFSYLLFGFLCFAVPISSGTFSGLPRYILTIFPLFIALTLIKNRAFKFIYCVVSIILLFLFFMLFSKGYFIS